jgi:iron(III)-enterobactin esterase
MDRRSNPSNRGRFLTLEQYSLKSPSGEFTRDIWLLPSAVDHAHRLCVFLDAEHYLQNMQCLPVLQALLENRSIPAISCLFVSHASGEARHQDLTCSDRYSRFIAEDVVAWARERNTLLQPADNVICGLSLSGLESAFIAFRYPEIFPRALCQSGSFWWLADHDVPFGPASIRLWLSVGSEETATTVTHPPTSLFQRVSQIEGVEAAVRRFESLGATVRYNLFSGGHAMEPWKTELAEALQWLLQP